MQVGPSIHDKLPLEMIHLVITYLKFPDLMTVTQVDSIFLQQTRMKAPWRSQLARYFPFLPKLENPFVLFKQMYNQYRDKFILTADLKERGVDMNLLLAALAGEADTIKAARVTPAVKRFLFSIAVGNGHLSFLQRLRSHTRAIALFESVSHGDLSVILRILPHVTPEDLQTQDENNTEFPAPLDVVLAQSVIHQHFHVIVHFFDDADVANEYANHLLSVAAFYGSQVMLEKILDQFGQFVTSDGLVSAFRRAVDGNQIPTFSFLEEEIYSVIDDDDGKNDELKASLKENLLSDAFVQACDNNSLAIIHWLQDNHKDKLSLLDLVVSLDLAVENDHQDIVKHLLESYPIILKPQIIAAVFASAKSTQVKQLLQSTLDTQCGDEYTIDLVVGFQPAGFTPSYNSLGDEEGDEELELQEAMQALTLTDNTGATTTRNKL